MMRKMNEKNPTSYELLFGPAHPGSGNFSVRLRIEGERVVSARADPGYLHRGFEKLMEYRNPMQNSVLSDRLCVLEPLNWNLIHAEAVDELTQEEIPEKARYIRVLMAELSRIQSHIIWYGAMSMGLGFDTGFKIAFGYRDYILDLFEMITGGRVYPAGYLCPGGVRRDLPESAEGRIRKVLGKMDEMLKKCENFEKTTILPRTKGVGALSLEDALRLGATGPIIRASGLKTDVRRDDPYEIYPELDFEIPTRKEGDAYARCMIRRMEFRESINIVKQVLEKMPEEKLNPVKPKLVSKIPKGEVYVRNEIARGEAGIYMKSVGGDKPYRCKIRGPSFLHMIPVLEHLLR
ncbi:MAG: NADH-quinone oxidoreductase subunit D, partial [Candidatus Altiarchaeales archaeon]|nr:NADH-quinone oxidoreductase subunit D [Candidatus Altiarchaeales archaeon]